MRTVYWQDDSVRLIDQRGLPNRVVWLILGDEASVLVAIRDMAVRGAPAIGATAAFGLALAIRRASAAEPRALLDAARRSADALRAARPTAVNLAWGLDAVLRAIDADMQAGGSVASMRRAALRAAERLADADVEANRRMGTFGAQLLPDPCTVIHHCNTGALATVDYGTALGVVRAVHEAGRQVHVLVDETRPRLQGARLTAWELGQLGVPHTVIVDGAAGSFLQRGQVDAVLVGADRIAANGDTANKIGTYPLAVVAAANGVPFYVVAPTSTVDLALADGAGIPIELRDESEVLELAGQRVAPAGTRAANPAFDVTPHACITAFVTEVGVVRPPYPPALQSAVSAAASGQVPAVASQPTPGVAKP
jgi:methylthioribose-1-phosphate isomerase